MKRILLFLAFIGFCSLGICQTITSNGSGNWSTGATWVGGAAPGAGNDVVIAAGHTVTVTSATTASSININAGGTLIISGVTVTITNNATNSGTINNNAAGGFRVGGSFFNDGTFAGSVNSILSVGGAQLVNNGSLSSYFLYLATAALGISNQPLAISGSASFTVNNIIMLKNSVANVTVSVPITLSANLNMGSGGGKFIIDNVDVQSNGISGGSANVYMITNGTGRIIYSGGVSTKTIPIGTSTSYTPLVISNGNVSTHTFAVRVSNTFTAPPGSSAVVNREWNIQDITGGANVDLTFQWNLGDETPMTFNRSLCAVARYDGSNWIPITPYGAASGSNPYTRTVTGVTTFSPFIIGSSGTFPIVSVQSGNWNTASTWGGGVVPAPTDNVIISSGHSVAFDVSNGAVNSLSVNNTSTLQLNASNILTVATNVLNSGTINMGSSSNLRIGVDLNNPSNILPLGGATNTVVSIGRNFSNTGLFNANTVYLSNTSLASNAVEATISGNSSITMNTLNILKDGANVNANATLSVSSLSLGGSSGNLVLGSINLSVSGSITGYSASKYIQTNGTGVLRVTGAAAPKIFPVGSASSYTPITISNGNVATHSFSVRVQDNFTHAPFNNSVVNKEWNISDITGGASVDVTFQWNESDEDPAFVRTQAHIGHHTGTTWELVSTAAPASGANPYTRTATAVTTFSPFGVGSNGALPVHLLNFDASKLNSMVKLKWITENEVSFSHYEIEKSADGQRFDRMTIIKSKQFNGKNEYEAADTNPKDGANYYRLKMVDKDGTATYSKIVRIDFKGTGLINVWPNPATDYIIITGSSKFRKIQFIDASGKIVREQKPDSNNRYTVGALIKGSYVVRLIADNEIKTLKFLLK